jgi:nucleotide-binding universal stress UspA family protein
MEPIVPVRIEHLLVPLDGSTLAEAVLPAAVALAERLGARVTLLHVLERHAPVTVHGDRHLTKEAEAGEYLDGVASRFAGATVERHVHPNPEGDVAASIAEHAAEFDVDLIVLCTHGRGGPRGWLAGSLAQQVVRRETPPVLLVRPVVAGVTAAFAPETFVVALDGTAEGEAALPTALALAAGFDATVRLLAVVATLGTVPGDRLPTARLTPAATTAALDLEQETTALYLADLSARVQAAGVPVQAEVGRGDAVRTVVEIAAQTGRHVLALSTHGRGGLDALWAGSVGAQVVNRAAGPLLLVHPQTGQRSHS